MVASVINRLKASQPAVNVVRNASSTNAVIGKEALYGAKCHNPESTWVYGINVIPKFDNP